MQSWLEGSYIISDYSKILGYCDIIDNLNFGLNSNQSVILQHLTHVVELKKYCATLLEKFASLSYTMHNLEELDAEARAEAVKLEVIHC